MQVAQSLELQRERKGGAANRSVTSATFDSLCSVGSEPRPAHCDHCGALRERISEHEREISRLKASLGEARAEAHLLRRRVPLLEAKAMQLENRLAAAPAAPAAACVDRRPDAKRRRPSEGSPVAKCVLPSLDCDAKAPVLTHTSERKADPKLGAPRGVYLDIWGAPAACALPAAQRGLDSIAVACRHCGAEAVWGPHAAEPRAPTPSVAPQTASILRTPEAEASREAVACFWSDGQRGALPDPPAAGGSAVLEAYVQRVVLGMERGGATEDSASPVGKLGAPKGRPRESKKML